MEGLGSFLPFIAIFAVMYFFMIAPQMKRAKQEKKFASELKRGDRIITKGEFECLHWLAKGKIYDEIAVILRIKVRTARFHLQALKEKTSCVTLFQLGSLSAKSRLY